jgi:hypothetical protein
MIAAPMTPSPTPSGDLDQLGHVHLHVHPSWVIGAALLLVAGTMTLQCGAWTRTTGERCRNRRPGPLNRCQHHVASFITASDLSCGLVTAASFFVLWLGHRWHW